MSEQQPGATPAAPSAPATPPSQPAANQPGTPPAAPANNQPGSGDQPKVEDGYVKIPLKQWEQTNRDAARYRSKKQQPAAADRHEQRYNQPPAGNGDEDDQQVVELRTKLTTTEKENMQLKLQNQVRDLLDKDEYKSLPEAAKRILKRNPLAVVDPRARNLEDAIADIQDYMDEELEQAGSSSTVVQPGVTPAPGQPGAPTPTPETPPVNGSRPSPANPAGEESVEGKTGPARSTAILKNIFKRGPAPKQQ